LPDLMGDPEYADISNEIQEGTFLTKLRSKENGVVSYQLQKRELTKILDNAAVYHSFLAEKDSEGISVRDKIVSIFEFKIPYYVGPMNTASSRSWVMRSEEKIYPWNFDKTVDKEASALEFINKLIGRCTYTGDFVLPRF